MEKGKEKNSFLSDVSLDFLDELDDRRDILNEEQFKYVQIQKRLDNMMEQKRKISSIMKNVSFQ
ncbi:MAG: hypothetical protein ACI4KB_00960 [Oscillospiraceae bacterium]|nr:hypothetical protein [Oscillospiraceae bacterium]